MWRTDMLKLLGSICIIAACSGIGFSKSQELHRYLKELEELNKLFYLIKSELQYTRAPFAEVFEKISKKLNEPYGTWLSALSRQIIEKTRSSFWEIWCQSIEKNLQKTSLHEDDLKELKNIGRNLEYAENLDMYIELLEYKIVHTRESNRSKRKLCQSMGVMGGIFLVILLL